MDFLTNAIFSAEDNTLLGTLLTHFEPDNYLNRASVSFYSKEELTEKLPQLEPRGFRFGPNGVLAADTDVRKILSNNVLSFVEIEYAHLGARLIDITDVVLYGVQYGGAVLVNPTEVKQGTAAPLLVPFQNYRVSQSSLNIYGSYQLEDGTFRTHSLLELEDGSGKDFCCVFPPDVDMSRFASVCQQTDEVIINDTTMFLYEGHSCLKSFYTCVGEAFLNFLAYNVAYFNVGRRFLREVSPAIKDATIQERSPSAQDRRYAKRNVSIEHTYDKLCLSGITRCNGDNARILEYLENNPEATITMHWLNKLFDSPWYQSTEGDEDARCRAACANLMMECKEYGLKYGLELLTHRHYLTTVASYDNYIPLVLKGGGVNGESLKRVTFK